MVRTRFLERDTGDFVKLDLLDLREVVVWRVSSLTSFISWLSLSFIWWRIRYAIISSESISTVSCSLSTEVTRTIRFRLASLKVISCRAKDISANLMFFVCSGGVVFNVRFWCSGDSPKFNWTRSSLYEKSDPPSYRQLVSAGDMHFDLGVFLLYGDSAILKTGSISSMSSFSTRCFLLFKQWFLQNLLSLHISCFFCPKRCSFVQHN